MVNSLFHQINSSLLNNADSHSAQLHLSILPCTLHVYEYC